MPEQHGSGPRHYACRLGAAVLERYPATAAHTSGVRLGLRASRVGEVVDVLRRIGATVSDALPPATFGVLTPLMRPAFRDWRAAFAHGCIEPAARG